MVKAVHTLGLGKRLPRKAAEGKGKRRQTKKEALKAEKKEDADWERERFLVSARSAFSLDFNADC